MQIELTDEKGGVRTATLVETVQVEGRDYAVLEALQDDPDLTPYTVVLRILDDEGERRLMAVEDAEELDKVVAHLNQAVNTNSDFLLGDAGPGDTIHDLEFSNVLNTYIEQMDKEIEQMDNEETLNWTEDMIACIKSSEDIMSLEARLNFMDTINLQEDQKIHFAEDRMHFSDGLGNPRIAIQVQTIEVDGQKYAMFVAVPDNDSVSTRWFQIVLRVVQLEGQTSFEILPSEEFGKLMEVLDSLAEDEPTWECL